MEKTDIDYKTPYLTETKYVPINEKNVIELKPEDEVRKPETLFLYFTVLTATLPILATGASIAWTSPAVVKLQSNETNMNPLGRPITTTELSMFLSIPGALAIVGSSILPKLADLIGRRNSLLILCFAAFLSTVALAVSYNIYFINFFNSCVATSLSGVGSILSIYIMEICEDRNRAKFGCFLSVLFPVGEVCSYIIGPQFSLRDFTLITAIPFVPFLFLFFFAPESPVYSLSKGKIKMCQKALKKLRSNKTGKELEYDFNEIQKNVTPVEQAKGNNIFKLFSSKEGKVGLILGSLPALVQLFCGVPIIMALIAPIFNESGSNLTGDTIAIIVGVVKIFATIFTSLVVEKTGRKLMLVISSFGMGFAISILGVFFYLNYINSPIVLQFRWVPLMLMLFYIIFFSLGVGTITNVLIGELFTSELRSTAFSFIMSSNGILFVIYAAGYPLVAASIGIHGCMWIFGTGCFLGALFMLIMLPETKGKSVIEIQEILKKY